MASAYMATSIWLLAIAAAVCGGASLDQPEQVPAPPPSADGSQDVLVSEAPIGLSQLGNAVPPDGACKNEGNFCTGNHCVKMTGKDLNEFQTMTHQDFSTNGVPPKEWCVCLHLYTETWRKGGGDDSACSAAAKAACAPEEEQK